MMFNYIILNAIYYYTCVVNFYTELLNRVTIKPPPLFVYKVLKVTDEHQEDLTDTYLNGGDIQTPDDVSWVEYRFTWKRDKKYRVVCTHPEEPGPSHDMLARANGTSNHKRIVMAVLVNPSANIEENVIDRVYKFAGPRSDFFGNKHLRMKHLFYNDDIDSETVLKVLWSDGSLLSYEPDTTLI
jgi:hypothetical protein